MSLVSISCFVDLHTATPWAYGYNEPKDDQDCVSFNFLISGGQNKIPPHVNETCMLIAVTSLARVIWIFGAQ